MNKRLTSILAAGLVLSMSPTAFGNNEASGNSDDHPGLGDFRTGTVTIKRDTWGVPHVYANSVYGLYYGYGYAIAQDRLFQMEMIRRGGQGLVSEVLGPDSPSGSPGNNAYLDFDINIRTGFRPAAIQAQLDALPRKERNIFDGYAAGMNSYIRKVKRNPGKLMPEQFIENGFEPSSWTGYDVAMIFVGSMIHRFGDFNTETTNLAFLKELEAMHGTAKAEVIFRQFYPESTRPGAATTVKAGEGNIPPGGWMAEADTKKPGKLLTEQMLLAKVDVTPEEMAYQGEMARTLAFSNFWAIGKKKGKRKGSEAVKAVLLGGPQFGYYNPAYNYSIGLHGAGFDVVGNAPFGYPAVMFGHNKHIAWGTTWGAGDHIDMFMETLNAGGETPQCAVANTCHWHNGEWKLMEVRHEVIKVRGGADVPLDVYRTVHGQLVSMDPDAHTGLAKARTWEGFEIDELLGWVEIGRATNFEEYRKQALRTAQSINQFYADKNGNIGYQYGGYYPVRRPGHNRFLPVTGDGTMDWISIGNSQAELDTHNPMVFNPKDGYIRNWNNAPAPGYQQNEHWFYFWGKADRSDILTQVLESKKRFTADEVWALVETASLTDVNARYVIKWITTAFQGRTISAKKQAVLQSLVDWENDVYPSRDDDDNGYYDELGTAFIRNFLPILFEEALADDIPLAMFPFFGNDNRYQNLSVSLKVLVETLNSPGNPAVYDFFNGKRDQVFRMAFNRTFSVLKATYGNNLDNWRISTDSTRANSRTLGHISFNGVVPQADPSEAIPYSPAMNRGTQNNLVVFPRHGGHVRSYEVTPPGQSGFIAPDGTKAKHYGDQVDIWTEFKNKPVWLRWKDVDANLESVTRLRWWRWIH